MQQTKLDVQPARSSSHGMDVAPCPPSVQGAGLPPLVGTHLPRKPQSPASWAGHRILRGLSHVTLAAFGCRPHPQEADSPGSCEPAAASALEVDHFRTTPAGRTYVNAGAVMKLATEVL